MSRFIESIKCKDGKLDNPDFHHYRFNQTRKKFFGSSPLDLAAMISIPEFAKHGIFKCRVLYSKKITSIEFIPHSQRTPKSLRLIENNHIKYGYKYANRERLNNLYEQRENCDDILILKNGCITDSFAANVVFYNEHGWYTPDTPLLPGTRRSRLLNGGKIIAARITPNDLQTFVSAVLINAMHDLNETPPIPIQNIVH